ncbi:MAG: hypothetical protein NT088_02715 [Candidatus Omnitrophica bacterium]|nr:hypothetical protein [Candidatus Omnitrophota bacterium]
MKKTAVKFISTGFALVLALAFVVKFGTPGLLRFYVQTGIGDCRSIPIMCMAPSVYMANPKIDDNFSNNSIPYVSDNLAFSAPKGFAVVEEILSKPFYKKHKRMDKGNIIYIVRKDKDFFVGLYPQLKHVGVKDDYEFIKRVMYARINEIRDITDTFFVIMKGVFVPDLGNQLQVRMVSFQMQGASGFINYNLGEKEHLFDCDLIGKDGSFYKLYIKDRDLKLDLDEVAGIISTLRAKN